MANHGLCKNCWWWQQYPFTRAVGLCFMQASDKLFISLISLHDDDRALLDKELSDLPKGKVEIISFTNDPLVYEYPAIDFIYARSKKEPTALFYYFHTKGIT